MRHSAFALVALIATAALAQQGGDEVVTTDEGEREPSGSEPATVVDELSQAEIEAELARADQLLDDPNEVEEFTDGNPLPADLPLALPSDF